MGEIDKLRAGWEEANDRVQAAEGQMAAAWAAFAAGRGDPPSRELIEELTIQRVECNRKLTELLEAFKTFAGTGWTAK